jgi:hypothetical protein
MELDKHFGRGLPLNSIEKHIVILELTKFNVSPEGYSISIKSSSEVIEILLRKKVSDTITLKVDVSIKKSK